MTIEDKLIAALVVEAARHGAAEARASDLQQALGTRDGSMFELLREVDGLRAERDRLRKLATEAEPRLFALYDAAEALMVHADKGLPRSGAARDRYFDKTDDLVSALREALLAAHGDCSRIPF